jgi:hypothetical protein
LFGLPNPQALPKPCSPRRSPQALPKPRSPRRSPHPQPLLKPRSPLVGSTSRGGEGYPEWGLVIRRLALTFARPRPPALTPLAPASPFLFCKAVQKQGGLVQMGTVLGASVWRRSEQIVGGLGFDWRVALIDCIADLRSSHPQALPQPRSPRRSPKPMIHGLALVFASSSRGLHPQARLEMPRTGTEASANF